jgi:stringent starvation protein B
MSPPLPPKREVALALLERSSVHVHLDPRTSNVVVPPMFKGQPQLVLQIGLNMPVPIPDLRLDEDGMSCTLSFSRSPFHCVIPWPAVFAMVGEDGRGMVWPDDLPPEVARQAAAAARRTQAAARETRETGATGASSPAGLVAAGSFEEKTREEAVEETLAKKKGGRKKPRVAAAPASATASPSPEDARARLVAVPAAPPSSPSSPSSNGARGGARPSEEPTRGRPSATPSAGAGRQGRAKRELPPYLRVVK